MQTEILGFERKDGTVGIRNHVAVVSVMDSVNPVAGKIFELVSGTVLVTDLFGRRLVGTNYEVRQRAFMGLATNPNIAGVLVLGLHDPAVANLLEPLAKAGMDVDGLSYQKYPSLTGMLDAGAQKAAKMVRKYSEQRPREFPLSKLRIGVECGGSDYSSGLAGNPALGHASNLLMDAGGAVVLSETAEIMGAEHILAKDAVSEEVKKKVYAAVASIEEMARDGGVPDIRKTNPSPDNKRGGLSTLAEKALGAVKKAGSRPLQDVLEYCQKLPADASGFYFMNTPSPACESLTGKAAGGAQLMVFNTGLGQPAANPVAPTIKMTGNPHTVALCTDDLDVEVSSVLTGAETLEQAGERVFREIIAVARGKLTVSEVFRMTQSTISIRGASM